MYTHICIHTRTHIRTQALGNDVKSRTEQELMASLRPSLHGLISLLLGVYKCHTYVISLSYIYIYIYMMFVYLYIYIYVYICS